MRLLLMKKKEISEVKKQLNINNCTIQHMVICYVDAQKQIRILDKEPIFVHPNEEVEKYLEILKQTLTGQSGKKLLELTMDDPKKLELLRKSKLKEDVNTFLAEIIHNLEEKREFLILLTYSVYDVPTRHEDNSFESDSRDVYQYIQCAICPVEEPKTNLVYRNTNNDIVIGDRTLTIGKPELGFLYPAFNDRSADCYHMLLYVKNEKNMPENVILNVLNAFIPMPAYKQKEVFHDMLSQSLNNCSSDLFRKIQESIVTFEEEKLDKDVFVDILEEAEVSEEEVESFCEQFEEMEHTFGIHEFDRDNLVDPKTKIQMGEVQISMPSEEKFEIKQLNGRKYIMMPVSDNIVVNGMVLSE